MIWKMLPLILATALYACQAIILFAKGDYALAAVLVGYIVANLGLIAAA